MKFDFRYILRILLPESNPQRIWKRKTNSLELSKRKTNYFYKASEIYEYSEAVTKQIYLDITIYLHHTILGILLPKSNPQRIWKRKTYSLDH